MGPMPAVTFDPAAWPEPRQDGVTELPPAAAASLLILLTTLVDYLEEQHAACATPARPPAD